MSTVLRARTVSGPIVRARAAMLAAPGRTELAHAEPPRPDAHQVRVRLEGSGVCGSNLPVWEGRDWFDYPLPAGAPGHEGWGTVDALGAAVTGVQVGDRVAILSERAFADFDLADASGVAVLPPILAAQPWPGEALGSAINAFRRSRIEPGQTVAIIGIGFLGALLTQLACRAGARVVALSRRPFALDVARACGAAELIMLHDHHLIIEQVRTLTAGEFCDCTIEATGMQWPLDLAGELTRERGRLVIAGFHQDGPRQVDMFLWNWRGLDVINAHERDAAVRVRGMREAIAATIDGVLDPSMLITHRYPLEETGTALRMLRDRPDGFLKAVVTT
jgi:threonine dehydrogenase-like Zn-dependent dehydrogenase